MKRTCLHTMKIAIIFCIYQVHMLSYAELFWCIMNDLWNGVGFEFRPPVKLLVIDDSYLSRVFIKNTFLQPDFIVFESENTIDGIKCALRERPELILMDAVMPEMDGFEAARRLKAMPETASVPLMFISAQDSIQDKLRAFDLGAVDFVSKPFNHRELMARVRTHVLLNRNIAQKEKLLALAAEEHRRGAASRTAQGVSHNFSNLLASLAGNVDYIVYRLQNELPQDVSDALTDTKRSIERMQSLIKKFILLADRANEMQDWTPSPAKFDLHSTVREIFQGLMSQKAESFPGLSGKLRNRIPENTFIFCDHAHIHEVIYLVINEVLELSSGCAACSVELGGMSDKSGGISFRIAFSGVSLGADIRGSIFEPFALPIANVGTGLSFSVAKRILELNNGTVSAVYPSDDEVVFTIVLPNGGD